MTTIDDLGRAAGAYARAEALTMVASTSDPYAAPPRALVDARPRRGHWMATIAIAAATAAALAAVVFVRSDSTERTPAGPSVPTAPPANADSTSPGLPVISSSTTATTTVPVTSTAAMEDFVPICADDPLPPRTLPNGGPNVAGAEVLPANSAGRTWQRWSSDPEWYVMAQLAGNSDAPDIFANNEPANLITGSAYAAAVLPIGDEHVGDTSIQIKDIARACVYAYLVGPGPSLAQIRQYADQLRLQYEQVHQTPPITEPSPADGNADQHPLLGDVFVTTTGQRAVIDVRDADGVVASFDLGCPPDRECGVTARVMHDAIWLAINHTEPGQQHLVVGSRVVSVTRSSGDVVEHLALDDSARVSSAGLGADGTLYAHVAGPGPYEFRLVAIENGGTRTLASGVAGFRLSDDGRLLAVSFADPPAGERARFEITNLVDRTTASFETDYTNAGPAAWSPDGRYLIVNEQWEDGTAWVVDPWSESGTPIAGTDGYLDGFLDGGCFMSNDVVAHRTWDVGYAQGDAQVGVIRLTDLTSGSTVTELGTNLFGDGLRCHADGSVTYVRRGIIEVEHAPGFSQPEPDYDSPVELVHLAPDGTATIRDSGDLRMV